MVSFPICIHLITSEVAVQSLSHVRPFATPWTAAHQASLSVAISQRLLKLMSIESVMPSNHLLLCRPLLPPSIFPSIGVFSNFGATQCKKKKRQTKLYFMEYSGQNENWFPTEGT